jgi:quinohemoprotein ethanol dehydrogenase
MTHLTGISAKLIFAASMGLAATVLYANVPMSIGAESDWRGVGGAADEAGFSQLTQINGDNVKKLGLVSSLDLEGEVSLEATPLAVDGILYFSGSYSGVYAVDGITGKLLWKYDPQVWKVNPNKMGMGVNRGVAYDNGRVFIGVIDGRMVALNAKTSPASVFII